MSAGRHAINVAGATVLAVVACLLGTAGWSPADAVPNPPPVQAQYGSWPVCRYSHYREHGVHLWRLHRMSVAPPNALYADQDGQMVGWRFVVQRTAGEAWHRVFASRIQKSVATTTQAAVFEPMTARISDADTYSYDPPAMFRLAVIFYWYASDGSVARTERWNPPVYPYFFQHGQDFGATGNPCMEFGSWYAW